MKHDRPTVYHAAALRDAAGMTARPGALAVRGRRVIAAGDPCDLPAAVLADADRIDLPDRLILPAMVNAHTHLELTTIGPRPYTGSFTDWVRMLQTHRPREPHAVWASVRRGAAMLRAAGVAAVGDIGGRFSDDAVVEALGDSGLAGVLFGEFIAFDGPALDGETQRLKAWCDRAAAGEMRLGLQPHAPYSTSPKMYQACLRAAADSGLPLATHLAETPEEAAFVADARGPFRDFVADIGVWEERYAAWYRGGLSPVQWMRPHLERAPWLLAHCNYVSDGDIAILADTGASVAYCPVASEYFGHRDHRYRDMLDAGVNVCLGTDSIVCQPPGEAQPMGILAQMRRLYRRDGCDPAELLAMATTRGRRALGLDEHDATLRPGAPAVFCTVAIDPDGDIDALIQALTNDEPCEQERRMNADEGGTA